MEHHIVIIGCGPRGIYSFRRMALALSRASLNRPVTIHVVEGSGNFGGGNVHDPGQPDYLLLNTVASQITAVGDDDEQAGKAPERKSLYGYLRHKGLDIGPNDYPARSQHGQYLSYIFDWTQANLPDHVTLKKHKTFVEDIDPLDRPVVKLKNGQTITADAVLLVTGHAKNQIVPGSAPQAWQDFSKKQQDRGRHVRYIHFTYPIEQQTKEVQPGETVYVIGMGLTAIDILKTFTIGRGGVFEKDRYVPCGREPRIILGSRIGIPYSARAFNQKDEQYIGQIFTMDHVKKLKTEKDRLNFKADLFPLIIREMQYVYYRTLLGDGFAERFLHCRDDSERQQLINDHVDKNQQLRWSDLENPWSEIELEADREGFWFSSLDGYHEYILNLMKADVMEAERGNLDSPLKNAVDSVLRDCRDVLRFAVNFGGLTPSSHRILNREFDRVNNRIAVGPPIKSARELILAMEAGIAELSGPDPVLEMDEDKGLFFIESRKIRNSRRYIQHVINGRIHGVNIETDASDLFRNMLKKGMIRPYVNHFSGDEYQPGGLDITEDFHVIDRAGRAHPAICAVGIPAEGKIWFNAADARPDVNSTAIGHLAKWADDVIIKLSKKEQDQHA